jgi:hypothetical protein
MDVTAPPLADSGERTTTMYCHALLTWNIHLSTQNDTEAIRLIDRLYQLAVHHSSAHAHEIYVCLGDGSVLPSARLTLHSTKVCMKFKNFRKKYFLVLRLPLRHF